MKTQSPVRTLAQAGLIAAMYAALTLLLPAPSFGIGQCRISEMLTILAVFTPSAIPGLAVGCLVSNLVGLGMGANPAGAWDLLFGPLATLAAALLTWRLRNLRVNGVPVLAALPPVVINAVVVGLELTLVSPVFTPQVLAINMLSVGIGQLLACTSAACCSTPPWSVPVPPPISSAAAPVSDHAAVRGRRWFSPADGPCFSFVSVREAAKMDVYEAPPRWTAMKTPADCRTWKR